MNTKNLAKMNNAEKLEVAKEMNNIILEASENQEYREDFISMDLAYIGRLDMMEVDAVKMTQEEFSRNYDRTIKEAMKEAVFIKY